MSKQAILELDHDACKTQAMAYLEQGFNCAQAVACTLAPAIGLDVDQTFRLMEGFGGGIGGYTETCGAVSGAVMAAGWVKSAGSESPVSKMETYQLADQMCAHFKAQNGSTICAELKGIGNPAGPLRLLPRLHPRRRRHRHRCSSSGRARWRKRRYAARTPPRLHR